MSLDLESCKRIAAEKAVDENIKDGMIVGVGSGSTAFYAIKRLAERVQKENLNIICIPSSYCTKELIIQNKMQLGSLDNYPIIDVTIDGSDECDQQLNCIKGDSVLEKMVARFAKSFIVIADYRKNSEYLTQKFKEIAIEVLPIAYAPVKTKIESLYGGEVKLRMGMPQKVGPAVSDWSNHFLDWFIEFDANTDINKIYQDIQMTPGVLDVGIFVGIAKKAYYGMPDGTVLVKEV